MGKPRKKPKVSLPPPPGWDMGATGPANRAGLVQEDAIEIDADGKRRNPNGVKRMRRVDMLEVWHRKGEISTAGLNAAERLRAAYERTETGPGWSDNDRVQTSPRPDLGAAIQADVMTDFIALARLIPATDRDVIEVTVLFPGTPAVLRCYRGRNYRLGMRHLREALDRLARKLGG